MCGVNGVGKLVGNGGNGGEVEAGLFFHGSDEKNAADANEAKQKCYTFQGRTPPLPILHTSPLLSIPNFTDFNHQRKQHSSTAVLRLSGGEGVSGVAR